MISLESNHHHRRCRVVRVDRCAAPWPLAISDIHSVAVRRCILLNLVEPDVARATQWSFPAGYWLSAFVCIHHQTQSIMCWYSSVHIIDTWREMSPTVDKPDRWSTYGWAHVSKADMSPITGKVTYSIGTACL